MGFENITPKVEEVVRQSGVQEGLVLCNAEFRTPQPNNGNDLDDPTQRLHSKIAVLLALSGWIFESHGSDGFDNIC